MLFNSWLNLPHIYIIIRNAEILREQKNEKILSKSVPF